MIKTIITGFVAILAVTNATVPDHQSNQCSNNEVFNECTNSYCEKNCAEPDLITTCISSGCTPGCICRPGYLRNELKQCVKPEECQPACKDPNEESTSCGDTCPTTCGNKDEEGRACPEICILGGCACKQGYVRGWDEKCIKSEECPTCKEPNEFYSCGSACDTTCATLGEICPIVNIKCNEMCYCKEGFARDSKGVCIPVDKCPPRQCKDDPNANVAPCGDPCPLTCDNKDEIGNRPCPAICIVNGCKCKDGFVKGSNGKCISVKSCPPRQCNDPNAFVASCGDPCPLTCENKDEKLARPCPAICLLNGCKCKDGFVKDSNGKCISIKSCSAPIQ